MRDPRTVIRKMQVTEKGTALGKQSKFLFEVSRDANKIEVKRAVESLFEVKVTQVNTMNYDGKRKRMRSTRLGKRSDWKRAVVTLATGQTINLV